MQIPQYGVSDHWWTWLCERSTQPKPRQIWQSVIPNLRAVDRGCGASMLNIHFVVWCAYMAFVFTRINVHSVLIPLWKSRFTPSFFVHQPPLGRAVVYYHPLGYSDIDILVSNPWFHHEIRGSYPMHWQIYLYLLPVVLKSTMVGTTIFLFFIFCFIESLSVYAS